MKWSVHFLLFASVLAFGVGVSPFIGWYTHLIWKALSYGWAA